MPNPRLLQRILKQAYHAGIPDRDRHPLISLLHQELGMPSQSIAQLLAACNGDEPGNYFGELDEIIENPLQQDPEWRRVRLHLDQFGFRSVLEAA